MQKLHPPVEEPPAQAVSGAARPKPRNGRRPEADELVPPIGHSARRGSVSRGGERGDQSLYGLHGTAPRGRVGAPRTPAEGAGRRQYLSPDKRKKKQ